MLVPVPEIRALITLTEKMCWCVINPVVYNGQHKKFYNSFSFIFFLFFAQFKKNLLRNWIIYYCAAAILKITNPPPKKNPKQPKKPKQTHLNYYLFIHDIKIFSWF